MESAQDYLSEPVQWQGPLAEKRRRENRSE